MLFLDVLEQDRQRVDVVDRNIEEALNLFGVQVHRQHAVDAGGDQHVGHQLGGNRHPRRTRAAILAGIAEVRDGSGDAAGRGALERIDDDQQFHQVVVRRGAGRLQDKDVLAAHMFVEFDADFAIREAADVGTAKGNVQTLRYIGCQFWIGVTGKNHQAVIGHVAAPSIAWYRATKAIRADLRSLQQMPPGSIGNSVAGEEGFEPSNAGIKIRCLDQLGDSPADAQKPSS